MLNALRRKFPDKDLTLIQGSYFAISLGENCYDAVVSVESLHHFTQEEKIPLYRNVFRALVPGGFLILTDYFAESDEQEAFFRRELQRLKAEQSRASGTRLSTITIHRSPWPTSGKPCKRPVFPASRSWDTGVPPICCVRKNERVLKCNRGFPCGKPRFCLLFHLIRPGGNTAELVDIGIP